MKIEGSSSTEFEFSSGSVESEDLQLGFPRFDEAAEKETNKQDQISENRRIATRVGTSAPDQNATVLGLQIPSCIKNRIGNPDEGRMLLSAGNNLELVMICSR